MKSGNRFNGGTARNSGLRTMEVRAQGVEWLGFPVVQRERGNCKEDPEQFLGSVEGIKGREKLGGEGSQRLAGNHGIEDDVRLQLEGGEGFAAHFPMLARGTAAEDNAKGLQQGALDGLWAGVEDVEDFFKEEGMR
jgi:hypothetical protein